MDLRGTWHRSWNGQRIYRGIVDIQGASRPNPDNHRILTIGFPPNGLAPLVSGYFRDGVPQTRGYGMLAASPTFSRIVILEGGWQADGGITMAGPARTRSEAVALSNRLLRRFLRDYRLH